MKIEKSFFGKLNEKEVSLYKLTNDNGMYATFIDMGGININLCVKDKEGKLRDVVLQYSDLEGLVGNKGNFGAIVARNANRLANATAKISGVEYKLVDNNNGNNLHSGPEFFHKNLLAVKTSETKDEVCIEFSYKFKDMEQGFPGNMDFKISYTLTNDNELKLRYEGISDKDSIFNPTWHAYFNLKGHDVGDISTHDIKIYADKISAVNEKAIPEKLMDVAGTPFDFRNGKCMTDDIDDSHEQVQKGKGFDHNFALNDYNGNVRKVVEVKEKESGINMEVYTDLPGIQFYTGNAIAPNGKVKEGANYVKRGGFCLETQYFPNAINDERFVSPLIKKGEKKVSNTIYKFL